MSCPNVFCGETGKRPAGSMSSAPKIVPADEAGVVMISMGFDSDPPSMRSIGPCFRQPAMNEREKSATRMQEDFMNLTHGNENSPPAPVRIQAGSKFLLPHDDVGKSPVLVRERRVIDIDGAVREHVDDRVKPRCEDSARHQPRQSRDKRAFVHSHAAGI